METTYVAAALLSACLHASWNAAVKSSPVPTEAMTAQMVMSALLVVPILAWSGLPAQPSWIWIAASTCCNIVTLTALLRAYEIAGFGVAYPMVRALSVLIVVPLATIVAGETLSVWGIAGVALVSGALLLLAFGNTGKHAIPVAALAWIALAGLFTAAFVMCDARGVRGSGSPWSYGATVSITNAIAMSLRQARGLAPWHLLAKHTVLATSTATAAVVSYLLILWVFSLAPIAPSAALRDTSAAFAIVIAIVWLKEPFSRLRFCAVLMSAAAVPLLRLA